MIRAHLAQTLEAMADADLQHVFQGHHAGDFRILRNHQRGRPFRCHPVDDARDLGRDSAAQLLINVLELNLALRQRYGAPA